MAESDGGYHHCFEDDEAWVIHKPLHEMPVVRITGFEIGEKKKGYDGNAFDMTLRVKNPTPETIPLEMIFLNAEYGMGKGYSMMQGAHTGEIKANQSVELTIESIPAHFSQTIYDITGHGIDRRPYKITSERYDSKLGKCVKSVSTGCRQRTYPCCRFKGLLIKPFLRPWRLG